MSSIRLFSTILALCSLFPSSLGSPIDHHDWTKRQTPAASIPYAVTGAKGGVQPRLEIRDLQANTEQFNIFLLGLEKFQAVEESDFLSYFTVAGIHGIPGGPWNGVSSDKNTGITGWAAHRSNLFLTWHRPQLALTEQLIVDHALEIANSFPTGDMRDRYVAAASSLRLPYWDWAMAISASGEPEIPPVFNQQSISVQTPTGSKEIPNPLSSYRGITWRSPSFEPSSNSLVGRRQNLYNLLSLGGEFSTVGNSWWQGGSGNDITTHNSFESIHDLVHGWVGGTMGFTEFSSFDPLFWLHHANVDRVWAIWQKLHPETYVEAKAQTQSSYWYLEGEELDAETGLLPFRSGTDGDFWTSSTVRDHTSLGYTYPDLIRTDQETLRARVNELYGPESPISRPAQPVARLRKRNTNSTITPESFNTPAIATHFSNSSETINSTWSLDETLYQIAIWAPAGGIPSSYTIHFFLDGPVNENTATWRQDVNSLGESSIAVIPEQIHGPIVTSIVPLNAQLQYLYDAGSLEDLSEGSVTGLLKNHLVWKVVLSDGSLLAPEEIGELKIALGSIQVTVPTSPTEFPEYVGGWKIHYAAMEGKPGALLPSDE